MKTKKQELINNPLDFSNGEDLLSTFYNSKLNQYCLIFNTKFFSYKTWNGYVNKRNYFLKTYCLTEL
jgi:hypothetical protein